MTEGWGEYGREDRIIKIDPQKHVRLRPGMYIGGTDVRALHQLVFEIVDEVIEETLLGKCDHLWLTLLPEDLIIVRDNGRGLPVEMLADGKRAFECIMTELGVRRKGSEYVFSGGMMMSVGLLAVNALAAECTVEVRRDGYLWRQSYREGVPQTEVEQVRPMQEGEPTGTTIIFRPDFTLFEPNLFNYDTLAQRAKELAYLLPGFTVTLRDERTEPARQDEFHFPNNLVDYVSELNPGRAVLHEPLTGSVEWKVATDPQKEPIPIAVDVALQYTDTTETEIVSYVNTTKLIGGWHVEILPAAIASVLNAEMYPHKRLLSDEDCLPGLTAVISVKHLHPSYRSNMKRELANPDVVGVVFGAVSKALPPYGMRNTIKMIYEKCLTNRRALHPDKPKPEDEL
jgi:DNA gyrase subunit B